MKTYFINRKLVTSCLGCALLAGCAFSSVDRPNVEKYKPLVAAYSFPNLQKNDALDIAAAALRSIGFEVGATTPELGEVKSLARPAMVPLACDCGSWNGTQINGTADSMFSVAVANAGTENTTIRTHYACATNFKGQNLWGATTRNETYQCASTGVIERQFIDNFSRIKTERGK